MRTRHSLLALTFWTALHSLPSICQAKENTDQNNDLCALYMAPSSQSTEEDPVWGLFAGRDYEPGETIGNNEMGVNLHHLKDHTGFDEDSRSNHQQFTNEIVTILESYLWVPGPAGAKFEQMDGDTVTFIPGPGIVSVNNAKMTNAQWDHKSAYQRSSVGEYPQVPHAGRGAQTPFYNVAVQSTEPIKAGAEIFLNYGANYVPDDDDEEQDLEKTDYKKLDQTIERMIEFFTKHDSELDEKSRRQIYSFLKRDVMKAAVGEERQAEVEKILPNHPDELHNIIAAGGSMKYDKGSIFRDLGWLEEEGFCADNIRFGASSIKEAGRGAFATRRLRKGSTITATPLVPIVDHSIFEMYPLGRDEEGNFWRTSDEVEDVQLLVNYCFGHPESSMMLLPVGPGVSFINHSRKPNAKIVWSDHPNSRKDWFQLAPEEMLDLDQHWGLLMEVRALRDIEADEEIFIDYGRDFEEAWAEHNQDWDRAHLGVTWPTKAVDLHNKYATQPYPTEQEETLPESIGVMAFTMIKESTAPGTLDDPKQWDTPEVGSVYDSNNLFEVHIVDRMVVPDTGSWNYTIKWLNVRQEATYVADVPHDAIVLVDLPGTSDHFVEQPFRHPILIPDDVFPQGPWRNLNEDMMEAE